MQHDLLITTNKLALFQHWRDLQATSKKNEKFPVSPLAYFKRKTIRRKTAETLYS
jgi:hypothetical protein